MELQAEIAAGTDSLLAVFDLDRTLTTAPTLLRFLWGIQGPARFTLNAVRAVAHLPFGTARAKERFVQLACGGMETETLGAISRRFAQRIHDELLEDRVVALLRAHQKVGHKTAIVSAALACYVEPLGELLQVDAVEATRVSGDQWVCEGRFEGPNCKGAEKVVRTGKLARALDVENVWAYADARSDEVLLRWAQRGLRVRTGVITEILGREQPG